MQRFFVMMGRPSATISCACMKTVMAVIIRVENEQVQEHFAEFRLPDNYCYTAFGFSEDEIDGMRKYLLHNAPLIWDMAREGRGNIA